MPTLPAPYDAGTFFEPTVLAGATIEMRCFSEETFGPLIPLFRFETDAEVVMMANRTEYGLAAYFYTKDLARAWRVAEDLEFGETRAFSGPVSLIQRSRERGDMM